MDDQELQEKLDYLFTLQASIVAENKILLIFVLKAARRHGDDRDRVFAQISALRKKFLQEEMERLEILDPEMAARLLAHIDGIRNDLGFPELNEEQE